MVFRRHLYDQTASVERCLLFLVISIRMNHGEEATMDAITPMKNDARSLPARCCIVGGGPAGMMLGYLFGRAGIETLVQEKHPDFFCDFRGDTVHPSTLQVMDELGLIDGFLQLPHQKLQQLEGLFGQPRCGSPICPAYMCAIRSSPSFRSGTLSTFWSKAAVAIPR
jgi:hypothetical protein